MNDYILLTRSTLGYLPTALLRGIFISLLEKADGNGELTISVRGLAEEIGVSYQTMRTAIAKLAVNAVINATTTQGATQRLTQVTICNYANCILPARSNQRKSQRNNNATSNATTTPKTTTFIPPTDEQVRSFVREKGYHFNPEQFVPFYQSKGWRVGKEPMKDWKAACRTWEASWKEKHGEQFYYEIQSIITTGNAATREASRDRMLGFANSIVSQSADKLADLYNGGFTVPKPRQD